MNKENTIYANDEKFPVRITRARARALESLGGIPPSSRPSFKKEQKFAHPTKSKRAASDENKSLLITTDGLQNKRRAVLKDLTNICEHSHVKSIDALSSFQAKGGKNRRATAVVSTEVPSTQDDVKTKLAEELSKIRMAESRNTIDALKLEDRKPLQRCMSNGMGDCFSADPMLSTQDKETERLRASDGLAIVDIDAELKDSQVWSLYAPDIYNNIRVTEIERRPSTGYMEKLQQDINPNMRGILIDWLVELPAGRDQFSWATIRVRSPGRAKGISLGSHGYLPAAIGQTVQQKCQRKVFPRRTTSSQEGVPKYKRFQRREIQPDIRRSLSRGESHWTRSLSIARHERKNPSSKLECHTPQEVLPLTLTFLFSSSHYSLLCRQSVENKALVQESTQKIHGSQKISQIDPETKNFKRLRKLPDLSIIGMKASDLDDTQKVVISFSDFLIQVSFF